MSTLPRTAFTMVQTAIRTLEPRDVPIPDIDDDSAMLRTRGVRHLRLRLRTVRGPAAHADAGGAGTRAARQDRQDRRSRGAALGRRRRRSRRRRDDVVVPALRSVPVRQLSPVRHAAHLFVHSARPNRRDCGAATRSTCTSRRTRSCIASIRRCRAHIAVMFNPLGAGFRWAVEMPNTRPGDTVVILGPGQRGLACVIACREVGAGTIIVTGHRGRRQQARAGAHVRRRSHDRRRQRRSGRSASRN